MEHASYRGVLDQIIHNIGQHVVDGLREMSLSCRRM